MRNYIQKVIQVFDVLAQKSFLFFLLFPLLLLLFTMALR